MRLSDSIASSSARIDLSRPTNSGITMCGNTTTSRSGSTGRVRVSGWSVMESPVVGDGSGERLAWVDAPDDSLLQVKADALPRSQVRARQEHGDGVKSIQAARRPGRWGGRGCA